VTSPPPLQKLKFGFDIFITIFFIAATTPRPFLREYGPHSSMVTFSNKSSIIRSRETLADARIPGHFGLNPAEAPKEDDMQKGPTKEGAAPELNFRGIHLTDAGKYAEAIAAFTEALELDHSMSGVFFNRAEARRLSGDVAGAKSDLSEALRLSPEEPDYLNAMGLLAYENDDFPAALAWYEKALALKPDFSQAWNDKGVVHFRKSEYGQARECFEKAAVFDPASTEALFNLADTYEELGLGVERARALEALKKARLLSGGGDVFED